MGCSAGKKEKSTVEGGGVYITINFEKKGDLCLEHHPLKDIFEEPLSHIATETIVNNTALSD